MSEAADTENIDIVPYSDELAAAHTAFSERMWPAKKRRRDEVYNRWKFRGPSKGIVEGLLLAVENGKVIGQLGLIPVTAKFSGLEKNAQWACDLMVDPEYRRHGIGKRLFSAAFSREVLTLGHNASPAADALMIKTGFKRISAGRTMFFPLNAKYFVQTFLPGFMKVLTPLSAVALSAYTLLKKKGFVKPSVKMSECGFEEACSLVSEYQRSSDAAQVLHDKSFLAWRAAGFINYSPPMKFIKTSSDGYAIHGDFGKYYYVYDWHLHSAEEIKALVSLAVNTAQEKQCVILQMIANDKSEEEILASLGFVRARNEEKIIHYSKDGFLDRAEKLRFTFYDTDINL